MATRKPKTVLYRRKREQRTDYNKRMSLLLSRKPRLVVRFTNQKIVVQLIDFDAKGDKVLVGIDSSILSSHGWKYSLKNNPAAYLVGLLFGKKASEKGIKEAILDSGFKSPLKKGKIYVLLKGVLDSGMKVSHGDGLFPTEERISGKDIQDYALKLKENKELYEKRFAKYLKNNANPEKIVEEFNKIKQKIAA
jgi:large subunit ribosomal protein L18